MPAHLAFIFVAKEYLNRAESKNDFVVLGPGGRDAAHRTRNFSSHADFCLPCIPCVTYRCLLACAGFYCFSKRESILIGLAADLVYPNVGAVLRCFERAVATQILGSCRG